MTYDEVMSTSPGTTISFTQRKPQPRWSGGTHNTYVERQISDAQVMRIVLKSEVLNSDEVLAIYGEQDVTTSAALSSPGYDRMILVVSGDNQERKLEVVGVIPYYIQTGLQEFEVKAPQHEDVSKFVRGFRDYNVGNK